MTFLVKELTPSRQRYEEQAGPRPLESEVDFYSRPYVRALLIIGLIACIFGMRADPTVIPAVTYGAWAIISSFVLYKVFKFCLNHFIMLYNRYKATPYYQNPFEKSVRQAYLTASRLHDYITLTFINLIAFGCANSILFVWLKHNDIKVYTPLYLAVSGLAIGVITYAYSHVRRAQARPDDKAPNIDTALNEAKEGAEWTADNNFNWVALIISTVIGWMTFIAVGTA